MALLSGPRAIQRISSGLHERMRKYLVNANREEFIYTASLAGSLTLAYNAFMRLESTKQRVRQSVSAGKMDYGMGKHLIRSSALGVISGAAMGAAIGAGLGNVAYNRFYSGENK